MAFSGVGRGFLGSTAGVAVLHDRNLPGSGEVNGIRVFKRPRLLLLAVVTVAVVALVVADSALAATDTLDQFQTSNAEVALVTGPSYTNQGQGIAQPWAQTFTAGLSGSLDRVSLDLDYGDFSAYGGSGGSVPSNDLTVDITGVNAYGAPDMGNVLATATISKSNTFGSSFAGAWYNAVFQTPPTVTAGTQYAIVAYAEGSDEYDWFTSQGDVYAGGESWGTNVSPPTASSSWDGETVYDLTFETWVRENFTSTISGSHKGEITVAPTQSMLVSAGAVLSGAVTVDKGGVLVIESGAKIKGSLAATDAGSITACGATITGPVTISGDTGQVTFGDGGTCGGNSITGNVKITGGTGSGVTFTNNTVAGSLTITHNQGTVTAAGNKVSRTTTTSPNP